jgi:hypothetical protein
LCCVRVFTMVDLVVPSISEVKHREVKKSITQHRIVTAIANALPYSDSKRTRKHGSS